MAMLVITRGYISYISYQSPMCWYFVGIKMVGMQAWMLYFFTKNAIIFPKEIRICSPYPAPINITICNRIYIYMFPAEKYSTIYTIPPLYSYHIYLPYMVIIYTTLIWLSYVYIYVFFFPHIKFPPARCPSKRSFASTKRCCGVTGDPSTPSTVSPVVQGPYTFCIKSIYIYTYIV